MARIRTIKPEFFTSADIVGLSFPARLLYIALWCEADREGRLVWRPATFKLRYFPGDRVDIDALARELIASRLVIEYGEGLAYIPKFSTHQHVNPREAQSTFPEPCVTDAYSRVNDACARVNDAQVGKEGKEGEGKEGKGGRVTDASRSRGSRLPSDWEPSEILKAWACKERPDLDIEVVIPKFRDYWCAVPGSKGVKLDWEATFRNFIRTEKQGAKVSAPDYSGVIANLKD